MGRYTRLSEFLEVYTQPERDLSFGCFSKSAVGRCSLVVVGRIDSQFVERREGDQ